LHHAGPGSKPEVGRRKAERMFSHLSLITYHSSRFLFLT
jgi:hypothetical protein